MHFHLDPLLISERGPNVMGLGDSRFVRFKDHLGTVIVDVERSEDQDKSREGLRSRQPNTNYLHREESKGALTKN